MRLRTVNLLMSLGAVGFAGLISLGGRRPVAQLNADWVHSLKTWGVAVLALGWLAGAIGLFFHRRLAWYVSLAGASILACGLMLFLFVVLGEIVHPPPGVVTTGEFRAGFIFASIVCPVVFGLELAVVVWLIVGLWKLRHELLPPPRQEEA